jgi:hypothetical protein
MDANSAIRLNLESLTVYASCLPLPRQYTTGDGKIKARTRLIAETWQEDGAPKSAGPVV